VRGQLRSGQASRQGSSSSAGNSVNAGPPDSAAPDRPRTYDRYRRFDALQLEAVKLEREATVDIHDREAQTILGIHP
jgi:hypothetical protein